LKQKKLANLTKEKLIQRKGKGPSVSRKLIRVVPISVKLTYRFALEVAGIEPEGREEGGGKRATF